MDYDRRLRIVILCIFSIVSNAEVPNTTLIRDFATNRIESCHKVYPTEIVVRRGEIVTLHCPSCFENETNIKYEWFSTVKYATANLQWVTVGNHHKITLTVNESAIYRCQVNGTVTSGEIKLAVDDNLTEMTYCEGLVSLERVIVLVTVLPTVFILVFTLAVGIYYLCKRRLASSISCRSGRQGNGISSANLQRCSDVPSVADCDGDDYMIPNQIARPSPSYVEVLVENPRNVPSYASSLETYSCLQPYSQDYENIEAIRNRQ